MAIVVSAIRKLVSHEVRVATYILIIATFVQLADILTEACGKYLGWSMRQHK